MPEFIALKVEVAFASERVDQKSKCDLVSGEGSNKGVGLTESSCVRKVPAQRRVS